MIETVAFHFGRDGAIRTVYSDHLVALYSEIGSTNIRRASHVEPSSDESRLPAWSADLRPVAGPVLGPFATRTEALVAEITWLEAHLSQL